MKSSGSGSGGGGAAMGLHAEQHYEYHQPLKVGDVVTAEVKPGKSWEKESKRAGKLKFSENQEKCVFVLKLRFYRLYSTKYPNLH